MKKHKNECYLLPSSDILKPEIPKLLLDNKFNYKRIIFYNTLPNDLSDLDIYQFDLMVFFSPAGIKSIFHNFPDYKQNKVIIATFGNTTANAAKEAGLKVSILSPTPQTPSMAAAIDQFLGNATKSK